MAVEAQHTVAPAPGSDGLLTTAAAAAKPEARRWLPPGQFNLADAREALCFLFPVPRSLMRVALQAA